MKIKRHSDLENFTRISLSICQKVFPEYSCKKSKHTYKLPQLVACLLIRAYYGFTLRRLEDWLYNTDKIMKLLGLKKVPDYSTFCKVLRKLTETQIDKLIEQTVKLAGIKAVTLSSADGTGLQSDNASFYFTKVSGKKKKALD